MSIFIITEFYQANQLPMKPLYAFIVLAFCCGHANGYQQDYLSELVQDRYLPDSMMIMPDKEVRKKIDSLSRIMPDKGFSEPTNDDFFEVIDLKGQGYESSDILPSDILQLDSTGNLEPLLNREKGKLQVKSNQIDGNQTVAVLKEKQSFLDIAYFEGVFNVLNTSDDIRITNLSPSLGLELKDGVSFGIGPTISIADETAIVGARSFLKVFAIKNSYVQLEDSYSGIYRLEEQSGTRHNVMIGGGYLFSVSSRVGLNIGLLYSFHPVMDDSPIVFRVGLSAFE